MAMIEALLNQSLHPRTWGRNIFLDTLNVYLFFHFEIKLLFSDEVHRNCCDFFHPRYLPTLSVKNLSRNNIDCGKIKLTLFRSLYFLKFLRSGSWQRLSPIQLAQSPTATFAEGHLSWWPGRHCCPEKV